MNLGHGLPVKASGYKGEGMAKARKTRAKHKKRGVKTKRPFLHRVGRFISTALSLALLISVLATGVIYWVAQDLPDVEKLVLSDGPPPIEILASDGSLLARYGQVKGEELTFEDIPPAMVQAIIAIEDRRFYDHGGIDLRGIARAMFTNLTQRRWLQGGSTITQQLAKNLFLTPERTLTRKLKEALLALALEREYDKDKILELYLNRVYFGGGAYGIDAASQLYFNQSARKLTYAQAAVLAGLVKAPSRLAPSTNPQAALTRARTVLFAMADAGFISDAQAQDLASRGVDFEIRGKDLGNRYFTDWIMTELNREIPALEGALTIETTLIPAHQQAAQRSVERHLAGPANAELEAGLIAIAPGGAVTAMVGGRDYGKSVFNRAVQAKRQPGSAFKLFVYAAALETGLSPLSTMRDSPIKLNGWEPQNDWNSFSYENITLLDAFAKSYNSVAVKTSERVGRHRVMSMAKRLGVTSPIVEEPSVALGTSEMSLSELSAAYATIAQGGRALNLHGIKAVRGRDGTLVHRFADWGGNQVVSAQIAASMTAMLEEVVATGTGRAANPGFAAAGKTGTSQDGRDGWFVGFTPDLTAGVWVGRDDGASVQGLAGGKLPARIWADFVREVVTSPQTFKPTLTSQSDEEIQERPRKRSFWDRLFGRAEAN